MQFFGQAISFSLVLFQALFLPGICFTSFPGSLTRNANERNYQMMMMSYEKNAVSRQAFIAGSLGALALPFFPSITWAAEGTEDLSIEMTPEEIEKERIRRKIEAQKASTSRASGRKSFSESLEIEKEKQKSMKKTKEQKRRDLCEELGRGC
mmetsp:Transcript_23325/g.30307  ORF Transcript_23325/g.30307 Transcript_23325/m.30307 type:complete len:152 (-) Transcript_23325:143-598(-)